MSLFFEFTKFINCCKKGDIEGVKKINISKGGINENYGGYALIHHLCQMGFYEGMKYLLQIEGIDVNNRSIFYEYSPLMIACEKGFTDIVELLLERKEIDINLQNFFNSPLYVACEKNHTEVVRLLLTKPSLLVNISKYDGSTPLSVTCKNGNGKIAKMLFSRPDIDINKNGADNKHPFDIAYEKKNYNIMYLYLNDNRFPTHDFDFTGCFWKIIHDNKTRLVKAIFRMKIKLSKYEYFISCIIKGCYAFHHFQVVDIMLSTMNFLNINSISKKYFKYHDFKLIKYANENLKRGNNYVHSLDASDLYVILNSIEDGFFVIENDIKNDKLKRFYAITKRIPNEIRMRLCNLCYGLNKEFIKNQDVLDARNFLFEIFK